MAGTSGPTGARAPPDPCVRAPPAYWSRRPGGPPPKEVVMSSVEASGAELLGQTVVLIGGSAGIGLETARRARAAGADVILTGRNPERLEQAAREVDALSTAAFDATDPSALERFFQGLPEQIDHVMVTAGGPY